MQLLIASEGTTLVGGGFYATSVTVVHLVGERRLEEQDKWADGTDAQLLVL